MGPEQRIMLFRKIVRNLANATEPLSVTQASGVSYDNKTLYNVVRRLFARLEASGLIEEAGRQRTKGPKPAAYFIPVEPDKLLALDDDVEASSYMWGQGGSLVIPDAEESALDLDAESPEPVQAGIGGDDVRRLADNLDAVIRVLEGFQSRLDRIEERLGAPTEAPAPALLNTLDTRTAIMAGKIDNINGEVLLLGRKQGSMEAKVEQMFASYDKVNSAIAKVEGLVQSVDRGHAKSLEKLDKARTTQEDKLRAQGKKLEEIEAGVEVLAQWMKKQHEHMMHIVGITDNMARALVQSVRKPGSVTVTTESIEPGDPPATSTKTALPLVFQQGNKS